MRVEYWYYVKTDEPVPYKGYIATIEGKVIFNSEKELLDNFSLHHPGCVLHCWNVENNKVTK